jgi:oligopeptide transport system substrate-binding protein
MIKILRGGISQQTYGVLKKLMGFNSNFSKIQEQYNSLRVSNLPRVVVQLLFIVGIFFFISCKNENTNKAQHKVFHYNQISQVTSLDPAFARTQANMWVVDHVYNGLLYLDDSLNVIPCLAKKWEISDNGLDYTFHLNNNVFFQDNACFSSGKGRKMTASDVAYSFSRIIDTTLKSSGSWIFKDRIRAINPFEAKDDTTFILHLAQPFRPMLGILTMQYCCIVPHEAVDFYKKDFRKNPVGTGAFKFKKWLENQGLFLLKNENYWERDEKGTPLPYLDGVRISFMSDRKTAYLEMMRGKLDYMVGLESGIINELLTQEGELQPKQLGKIQLIKTPYLNSEYLGFNLGFDNKTEMPHLKLKKIRQALNYGFDRELMLRMLRNSMGKPATSGFAPRGLPSFKQNTEGYNFNPEKARKLLAEAGFPNGKGLPTIQLVLNKDYLDLCTFISRQWEELGIKTNLDVMETATMRDRMVKGSAPFFRASWIADYPDAESFYTVFSSKNPAPPNYTRFKNAEFDRLYEAALSENNDDKRYAIYNEMDKILIEEAPVIFLFYDESSRFARHSIEGLSRNAMNLLPLKRVKK